MCRLLAAGGIRHGIVSMGPLGPVLTAVVASICQGDLNVPHFARTHKARSLDGVARAPLRVGLKPCMLPVALLC